MIRLVEVDKKSGFCFGVVKAIEAAEQSLHSANTLSCLGDIVHNESEVVRLEKMGMSTISYDQMSQLSGKTLLIRAHGEPPSTYQNAVQHGVTLIDATCPVVLKLQARIKKAYERTKVIGGSVVIYGKKNHAEVNGLVGQTEGKAIIIENEHDIDGIDFVQHVFLFSQTTQGIESFNKLVGLIKSRIARPELFEWHDTICRQVAGRVPHIQQFASQFDLILFVGGKKSSNAQVLYKSCKEINSCTYFISNSSELDNRWFADDIETIGICGATSTPFWLMEEVAKKIKEENKIV